MTPTVFEVERMLENHGVDDLPMDYEMAEQGFWEREYKDIQTCFCVIHHPLSGAYFGVKASCTGDHWSGYETTIDYVEHVKPVQKTVTEWVPA